jgi:hypothetical protein
VQLLLERWRPLFRAFPSEGYHYERIAKLPLGPLFLRRIT